MLHTYTSGVAEAKEFTEQGDFFRVMSATAAVDVIFYDATGAELARSEGVQSGYAERFRGRKFGKVRITSATAQAIQFVVRDENEVFYDQPPNGQVTVTNVRGAFTSTQKTVTNASGSLVAANAARRYLLVQNNDAAGIVYVNLQGATATAVNGVKLNPGDSLELQGYVPDNGITAIGSIASNTNVVAVEG